MLTVQQEALQITFWRWQTKRRKQKKASEEKCSIGSVYIYVCRRERKTVNQRKKKALNNKWNHNYKLKSF